MHRDHAALHARGNRRALGSLLASIAWLVTGRPASAQPRAAGEALRPCPSANKSWGGAGAQRAGSCPPGTACAVGLCRPLPNPPCDASACLRPLYHPKATGWVCASACGSASPRCVAGRCRSDLPTCLHRAGEEPCGDRCCQSLLGDRCCRLPTGPVCCPGGRCGRQACLFDT